MDVFPEIKIRMPLRRLQKVRGETVMNAYVEPIFLDMVEEIKGNTEWGPVRESYEASVETSRNRVYYSLANTSDLFEIEERGAVPHDIPQPPHVIPGGKLIDWMDERAIPIEMYGYIQYIKHAPPDGGWVTHHPGLPAHNMVANAYEKYLPLINEASRQAAEYMVAPDGYEDL